MLRPDARPFPDMGAYSRSSRLAAVSNRAASPYERARSIAPSSVHVNAFAASFAAPSNVKSPACRPDSSSCASHASFSTKKPRIAQLHGLRERRVFGRQHAAQAQPVASKHARIKLNVLLELPRCRPAGRADLPEAARNRSPYRSIIAQPSSVFVR